MIYVYFFLQLKARTNQDCVDDVYISKSCCPSHDISKYYGRYENYLSIVLSLFLDCIEYYVFYILVLFMYVASFQHLKKRKVILTI